MREGETEFEKVDELLLAELCENECGLFWEEDLPKSLVLIIFVSKQIQNKRVKE